jgi:hypothetical protein
VRQLEEEVARLRPPPRPPSELRVIPAAVGVAATIAAIALFIFSVHEVAGIASRAHSVHEVAGMASRAHSAPDLGAREHLPARHRTFEVVESDVFETELLRGESSLFVDFHFSKRTYVRQLEYIEKPWYAAGQGYGHGTLFCAFHQGSFEATIAPHDPPFYMYDVRFNGLPSTEPVYFEAGDTVRCLLESEAGLHGLWRVSLWTASEVANYEKLVASGKGVRGP